MTVSEDEAEWESKSETSGEEEDGSDRGDVPESERNLHTTIKGEVTQTPAQSTGDTKPQEVLVPTKVSKRERKPANTSCRPSEYARYDTTTPCLQ